MKFISHVQSCLHIPGPTLSHGIPAEPVTYHDEESECVFHITATLTLQIISEIPSIAVLRKDKRTVSNNNRQVHLN